mmetsp:Transcript_28683/g.89187  ORF Transcript_28683/g.89187 Transcript_28683/m.89187 type:complete len:266 (-) Transcript_28683:1532-2329(-)
MMCGNAVRVAEAANEGARREQQATCAEAHRLPRPTQGTELDGLRQLLVIGQRHLRLLELPEEGHLCSPVRATSCHTQLAHMARGWALSLHQVQGLLAPALLVHELVSGGPIDACLARGGVPLEGALLVAGAGHGRPASCPGANLHPLATPMPLACRPTGRCAPVAVVGQGSNAHVGSGGPGLARGAEVIDASAPLAVHQARALLVRQLPPQGAAIAQGGGAHLLHGPSRGLWRALEEALVWRDRTRNSAALHRLDGVVGLVAIEV